MNITTGNPTIDAWLIGLMAVIGALYAILTALAAMLPKDWPFTHWCAQVANDLRKIRSGGDSPAMSAKRSNPPKPPPPVVTGVMGMCLALAMLVSCSAAQKQTETNVAQTADRIFTGICGTDTTFETCTRLIQQITSALAAGDEKQRALGAELLGRHAALGARLGVAKDGGK